MTWRHVFQTALILLLTTPSARAALDAEAKSPYQLQIVLTVGANRAFTPLFQDQLRRDVANRLKLVFGDLARIEVTATHPLLADIDRKGLDAALESYDALSERTTHFVFVDFAAGSYSIQTRFHDGFTGQAGPPATRITAQDRADLGNAIVGLVETSFSPVGTVTRKGKDFLLTLRGGQLGVPLDPWVKKGHVFAVSRIVDEGGRRKASRVDWALLEVIDLPGAGVCRCRYWRRYQEDDLSETPGTLGYRAVRLATTSMPVTVRLLDDVTLAPLDGKLVRVQPVGGGKAVEMITNRDGLASTREKFDHLALVQVLIGETVRAQFPVELMPGRTAVARVKIQADGEALTPLVTRRDAWLRRIDDNGRMSMERARDLQAQLHQSLDAAVNSARKSLPALEAEVAYLETERGQLSRLAKEKKWAFDAREGDHQLAELRKQAKELRDFVGRVEGVLKEAGSESASGLVQLLERARLHETEAEFDQAIKLYDQVLKVSPGEKKVEAHLAKLKSAWAVQSAKHAEAREFIYKSWPTLDAVGLGKKLEDAQAALASCKAADDKLTPVRMLRANAVHTANLRKLLDTLKRRDTEDNRNQAKALARTGEALLRLHQEAAAWVGASKD